ncbi:T9SS type A sorting domain-containing protein [Spirosoma fluminis]
MTRKILLVFLISLVGKYACYAQDPTVGGIASVPNTLPSSTTGTVQANFGNNSSVPIPQANNATYTINLPSNIGVTSFSITPAAPNLSVTIGAYDPQNGTIVTIVSNQGPVPANANYNIVLNVLALKTTNGAAAPISINARTSPAVGTNDPQNDNAAGNIIVTGTALPVNLISFTAKAQDNRTVALEWSTSLETSNKGFVVERSKDLKAFEKVGEVSDVAANSTARKNYRLFDNSPFQGTSYYRLTQIDLSGKSTAYPTVSVVLRDGAYGIFPNPVVNDQVFRISMDEPETATVRFYNVDGRSLPFQKAGTESGSLLLKSVGKLPTGVYIVTVEERGQTRKHRVVVE